MYYGSIRKIHAIPNATVSFSVKGTGHPALFQILALHGYDPQSMLDD
jgi:hypothetical protein